MKFSFGHTEAIIFAADQDNMKMTRIVTRRFNFPCGDLVLGAAGDRLCLCDWAEGRNRDAIRRRLERELGAFSDDMGTDADSAEESVINAAAEQLNEYFGGLRKSFDIPLLTVGTDFQKKVWRLLTSIPYGSTISYAGLSEMLGCPGTVRAVANANGANAISIFIPCHRVIGSDGSLTGYAGGLDAKRFLLDLEAGEKDLLRLQY